MIGVVVIMPKKKDNQSMVYEPENLNLKKKLCIFLLSRKKHLGAGCHWPEIIESTK